MRVCDLHDEIDVIIRNYDESDAIFFTDVERTMPDQDVIIEVLKDVRNIMFPGYFTRDAQTTSEPQYFLGSTILRVERKLTEQVCKALYFRDAKTMTVEQIRERADEIVTNFLCTSKKVSPALTSGFFTTSATWEALTVSRALVWGQQAKFVGFFFFFLE